ncbi:MAG TPA: hypothetical protein PKY77_20550 [Phycisphaerae bacterium]|nr:hypothetical protein [Phycisphaerae bacterium]HRY71115.1 hypothetical protein [Phycisphaerae bacterium]HSA29475.1 hypothetical protein [Phycisphaerae bacterium]
MERHHIESLVADQLLGELSAPASWLLERYLAEHPEYAREVEQVRRTIRLAKSALLTTQPAETPLPPMPRLHHRGWTVRMRNVAWPAACAACLMLGWLLGPAAPTASPTVHQAKSIVKREGQVGSERPSTMVVAGAADGQFWSVRSWVERSSRSPKGAAGASAIVWKAPFQVASN